jgi:predicted ATP-grasp superfamily ATP-dependent carboligase
LEILVYEHVSGGGFADEALPVSVLSEGFSMLRTLIADFKAAGHGVTTMLDSRIARLKPPVNADCIVQVSSSQDILANLQNIAEQADYAYVIAPETNGVLQALLEFMEQTGVASLNGLSSGIKKVSDKAAFHESIGKLGLPIPKTKMFNVTEHLDTVNKAILDNLPFPVVFKPSDGVSCSGLSVVKNKDQVANAVNKIKRESSTEHFLVQELIVGTAASVSILSTGDNAVPVSLNRQDIAIEPPEVCSTYSGGVVPLDHPLHAKAIAVAEKLVKSFSDLRGYVGVDFVLTEDEAVVVEVNPRLTTSYVGLRRVVNFNAAQAILDAVVKQELPTLVKASGYAFFSKVETSNPTLEALQKTYAMEEVVSPPFPVSESDVASALVISYGATIQEAQLSFRDAKMRVFNTISRGM